jgi:cytochrome c peroxidase
MGPPNALPVQFGGKDLRLPGVRAAPSLRYLQAAPHFVEHSFETDTGDDSIDNGPTGGLTWDGRADRGRDQARMPLFSRHEMANGTAAELAARLRRSPLAREIARIFGEAALRDDSKTVDAIALSLEVYQQDNLAFYPYSSKYDAYLAGHAELTAQEARGLTAFNDPAKGNCAICHISQKGQDGSLPQFTDYGFAALAVPRNRDIPANADPAYHDLGLCGPYREDFKERKEYCGLFRTPSLRNVALRQAFFHNGAFHNLQDVMEFYAERDTNPEKWYPRNADGTVRKFDDLPTAYHANVNTEMPFGQQPGETPALTSGEIADIIVFLATLTDGYFDPARP